MKKRIGSLVNYVDSIEKFFNLLTQFNEIKELGAIVPKFYFLFSQFKEGDLNGVIERVKEKYSNKFTVVEKLIDSSENEMLYSIDLVRKFYERKLEGKSLFYFNKKENYVLVFTDSESKFVNGALIDFTNKMYPFFARLTLQHFFIVKLIENLQSRGYICLSSMLSKKKWWQKAVQTNGEAPSSGVEFPVGIPFDTVLSQISKENSFIDALIVSIQSGNIPIVRFYISRSGLLQFISGDYEFFRKEILDVTTKYGLNVLLKFKDRNRDLETIRPLKVAFSGLEQFSKKDVVSRFSSAITSNKAFTPTVLHSGNPYFNANVNDLEDGSTFSVLFYNREKKYELILIPQYTASSTSLMRFFDTIFTNFGEGEIEEVSLG